MKKEIIEFMKVKGISLEDDTLVIVVTRDPFMKGISISSLRLFNNRSEAREYIYQKNLSDPLNEYTMMDDIDTLRVLLSKPRKSDAFIKHEKGATIFSSHKYMRMLEDYIDQLERRLLK